MIRTRVVLATALALVTAPVRADGAPADPLVRVIAREVPVQGVLTELYRDSGVRLEFEPGTPDPPVTVNLDGVRRSVAARVLARLGGLQGTQIGGVATFNQSGAAGSSVARITADTITATVQFGMSTLTDFAVGPGGVRFPNTLSTQIRTTRRFVNGQPTMLGAVGHNTSQESRVGIPGLPFGSRFRSSSSSYSAIFVTVTILPDPLDDQRPRRRR